jgi:hypothetical protein
MRDSTGGQAGVYASFDRGPRGDLLPRPNFRFPLAVLDITLPPPPPRVSTFFNSIHTSLFFRFLYAKTLR